MHRVSTVPFLGNLTEKVLSALRGEESVALCPCLAEGDAVGYGDAKRACNQAKEDSLWELSKTMYGGCRVRATHLIAQIRCKTASSLVWACRHRFILTKKVTKTRTVRLIPSKLRW